MTFFRIKKIKGKEYAYLVENEWNRKGSRQKVKGYIGRAYRFDLKSNVDFWEFLKIEDVQDYIEKNNKNKIINDLLEWELSKFGISKDEFSIDAKKSKISGISENSNEEFSTDLSNLKIQKNNKNIALLINDGFMCNLTLKNLLEFKAEGDEQNDGYRLARAFVEAGIKVPQDVFVSVFGKIYKTTQ